jgi:hypothetical protein
MAGSTPKAAGSAGDPEDYDIASPDSNHEIPPLPNHDTRAPKFGDEAFSKQRRHQRRRITSAGRSCHFFKLSTQFIE